MTDVLTGGPNPARKIERSVIMAKRHIFKPGDWESIAYRLDEIISAHSGEDPFEEALKLLVARLEFETSLRAYDSAQTLLLNDSLCSSRDELNRMLCSASARWPGILEPGCRTRLSDVEVSRCSHILNSVSLLADNVVGLDVIFEFLVNKAAKGQKGQYFTPRYVIDEVIRALSPTSAELVADPACGSAGFLRHCLSYEPTCRVWGFDQDFRAIKVARVMLAASGQAHSSAFRVDSLQRSSATLFSDSATCIEDLMHVEYPKFKGFDVIATNPPFAGDVGTEFSSSYDLAANRRVERDVLFLERCVGLLKPFGRLGIVLPYNKLGGERWGFMRKWFSHHMDIVAVVGLGRNTFMPHTSQKACVLYGVKKSKPSPPKKDADVLFVIPERDGKDARGALRYKHDGRTVDHDLCEATDLVRDRFTHFLAEA